MDQINTFLAPIDIYKLCILYISSIYKNFPIDLFKIHYLQTVAFFGGWFQDGYILFKLESSKIRLYCLHKTHTPRAIIELVEYHSYNNKSWFTTNFNILQNDTSLHTLQISKIQRFRVTRLYRNFFIIIVFRTFKRH